MVLQYNSIFSFRWHEIWSPFSSVCGFYCWL